MLKKIFVYTIIFNSLFFMSCSDDGSDNPLSTEGEIKPLLIKQIEVPSAMQNSTNVHAITANSYIQFANSFEYYSVFYTPPSTRLGKILDEWTKTWTSQGMTIDMNYFENSDNYGWKVYLTGTQDGQVLDNWLFMDAIQNYDDSYGTMKMYDFSNSNVALEWNWMTDSDNVYNFDFYTWDDVNSYKLEIDSNDDNSGELIQYESEDGNTFIAQLKIEWTSAGTGNWWQYDSSGAVTDSGSF